MTIVDEFKLFTDRIEAFEKNAASYPSQLFKLRAEIAFSTMLLPAQKWQLQEAINQRQRPEVLQFRSRI